MMTSNPTAPVWDPNSNVDPTRPLFEQPLPKRPGMSGMYYSEGSYMIMSATRDDGTPHGYVALVRWDGIQSTLLDHYGSWADALTAMDWYTARERREWDIERERREREESASIDVSTAGVLKN